MNKLLLENGFSYFVIVDCDYEEKKYLYLINEKNTSDIKIVEYVSDTVIREVMDVELLKEIIGNMVLFVDKFYE